MGDIHGEIDALRRLLRHLGYSERGDHPKGRRLVFVGDLADRGPDSPAVFELVMQYVREGRAQCILGNHELNLLRNEDKDGNVWFMHPEEKDKYPFTPVSHQQKKDFIKFMSTLPLALVNSGLRVVHACWHTESMAKLEKLDDSLDALCAYQEFESALNPTFTPPGMTPTELKNVLNDLDREPSFMADLARHDAECQMANPVRVLTSGVETPAEKPFWAGGKWRMVERVKWWETYQDKTPVVIGHYWRRFANLPPEMTEKDGPDLFEGVEPHHWLGPRHNVYCVDFSVGHRHKCRVENLSEDSFSLAALRWPEKLVMHDKGHCADLVVKQKAQR